MKKILTLCCAASLALSVSAQNYAPKVQELDRWSFSKDGSTWTEVTVPHSYNAEDGHSASYYRGTATYKREIRLSGKRSFLLLEGAAQAAEIRLDGKTVATHKGGYTPFTVRLDGKGKHVLEVICDNHEDVQLAPVSSDFNKNGGLHNPAHLLEMGVFLPCPAGYLPAACAYARGLGGSRQGTVVRYPGLCRQGAQGYCHLLFERCFGPDCREKIGKSDGPCRGVGPVYGRA